MKKIKLNKVIIAILIALNLFAITACTAYEQGLNSRNPLLYRNFNYFYNKDEFKSFYKDKINLTTGNEEQRSILLTNIYNAQNFLAHLDINISIISRAEMIEVANEFDIDTFAGLYEPEKGKITVVEYDTDTSIHELGHAVYYQLLSDKNRNKVADYYKEEATGLIDKYGQVSAEEFFAVAFTEYIYSPDTLKTNCPDIYRLINDINNKLK